MVKSVLLSMWLMGLVAGSVFFFSQAGKEGESIDPARASILDQEFIKIDSLTAAIIRSGAVRGYLILDLVVGIENGKRSTVAVTLDFLLRDLILQQINANKDLDIFKLDEFDLETFSDGIRVGINERVETELVKSVLVQKFDFISIEDVRDNKLRRS